ncbi:MAG TPA: hypothetical protein VGC79_02520 [Polyangiaceae bacterium]
MFNLRSLFAFWAVVAVFLGSAGLAQAQTTGGISITIPAAGVKRDHQDYSGKVLPTQINYKDCLNEDFFTFTVNLGTGAITGGYSLEIWAGTGCDSPTARPPSNVPTCWQVTAVSPTSINMTLRAEVRAMLAGRTGGQNIDTGGSTGGTGGTDSTGGTGGLDATGGTDASGGTGAGSGSNVPAGTPPACTPTSTAVGAQTLTLYFLLIDGNLATGGQAQWKGTYKLVAPDPPTGVKPGIGENQAPISWTAPPVQTDQTIDGYQLYCDPAPGQDGLDEAGVIVDPGILPTGCTESSVLFNGARPDEKYKCGSTGKTSTQATASNLINNVAYNVAVAATDTYRNVGVVSNPPVCAIPQPVTGFFDAYRESGGGGGGGFCSFSRHRQPLLLLTVLGLGLCLVLRRRRAT